MRAASTEIENHRPRTHPGTVAKQLGPKSSRRRRRTNPQAPEPTAGTRTGGVGCCQRRTNHERTHPPQLIANRERLSAPRHEREDDKWARQLEDAQNGTYDQASTEGGQPDQPVVDRSQESTGKTSTNRGRKQVLILPTSDFEVAEQAERERKQNNAPKSDRGRFWDT
ncbi:hypothetical protein pipiens_016767 [Culex pipiens pipiens]|uniref:Uncharacterized protein n=1 Tax=Culex pipiens pipiens TaxID=38569 RepID=A0ABD1CJU7_CULPP